MPSFPASPNTDVKYTNDDLHRLMAAQEGKLASGTISNQNFKQNWSLSLTGNWLSFDETVGSGGTATRTETRSNNAANEIASRVVDSGSSVSFVYNPAGQLVDDGEKIYTYDAWGRLRYVHVRDGVNDRGDLIEESRYNGLGHRIGYHSDQDLDNDVEDAGDPDPDPWIYNVYDDSWRIVAVFKAGSAVDRPHERYVYHAAGMDGRGSSSYIDDVILRERDDDVLLTGTASESLTGRMYYLQNWRHDVVATVTPLCRIVERTRYTSYGVPTTHTGGDFNRDGQVDDDDFVIFEGPYNNFAEVNYAASTARSTGDYSDLDLNVDGNIEDGDFGAFAVAYGNFSAAKPGELSHRDILNPYANVDSRIGYAGYAWSPNTATYNVRYRVYNPTIGCWTRRDPIGYGDGANLYTYVYSSPLLFIDPSGLKLQISHDPGDSTKRDRIANLLKQLCPSLEVDETGRVHSTCDSVNGNETPECSCIKKLAENNFDNKIYPAGVPETRAKNTLSSPESPQPDPNNPGATIPGPGLPGEVYINPDQVIIEWEDRKRPQNWYVVPNDIWLYHELCGHLLPINSGTHPPGDPRGSDPTITPTHEVPAVDLENELRRQRGVPEKTWPYNERDHNRRLFK